MKERTTDAPSLPLKHIAGGGDGTLYGGDVATDAAPFFPGFRNLKSLPDEKKRKKKEALISSSP